jgi:DNA primase
MAMTGQSFLDSLKELASRANYSLPALSRDDRSESGPNRAAIYEVMKKAQDFYARCLAGTDGRRAMEYLKDRGIGRDPINSFGLGLAVKEWDRLLHYMEGQKFSLKVLTEAGLVKKSQKFDKFFDIFRNRIIFPVYDNMSRVIAFAARTYVPDDQGAKYINSSTTPIFEKGRQLYGFNLARPHIKAGGVAFIVEGYFDVIALAASGVKAVVAAMGTSLTQDQVNSLKGVAKEVQLVFDGDSAGVEAAKRALPLLYNASLDGRVICLPSKHDPDTFVREFGPQAFYELADKAQDLSEFYLSRLLANNAKTITGQSKIITEMQEILRQVPDGVKGQFLRNMLADRLGLSPEMLELRPVEKIKAEITVKKEALKADYNFMAGKLLRFVIIHDECLKLIDEQLLEIWPEDRTMPVLVELINQIAENPQKPEIREAALRLEDDPLMSSLVSEAALHPREYPAPEAMKMAKNMITKLKIQYTKRLNEEFTRAIKLAESIGDQETVMKLLKAKPQGPAK